MLELDAGERGVQAFDYLRDTLDDL